MKDACNEESGDAFLPANWGAGTALGTGKLTAALARNAMRDEQLF